MVNYMWIINSLLAALFSGLTTFFAKIGLKKEDSTFIAGIRTIIIFIFSIIIYFIFENKNNLTIKNLIYIFLSGVSTTILWIVYFKALSLQNVSLVTPIDKLSIIMTLILSTLIFKEDISIIKIVSMILIIIGAFLMINKKDNNSDKKWIIYAFLTALFTSISSILAKIGLKDINPYLATLFRTFIVLIIIWIIIIYRKKCKKVDKYTLKYVILSGICTSLSWIFYFKALKNGIVSIVFSLEKLSAAICVLLSIIFLKERLTKKGIFGFILLIVGTILLIL